jgi:hypothetical protein
VVSVRCGRARLKSEILFDKSSTVKLQLLVYYCLVISTLERECQAMMINIEVIQTYQKAFTG